MSDINSIYQALDRIQRYANGKDISSDNFAGIRDELDYVREKLDITDLQAVLFAIVVELGCDGLCTSETIANHLGISNCLSMTFNDEMCQLEEKHLMRQSRERFDGHRCLAYYIPTEILNVLSRNEKYVNQIKPCKSNEELFFAMDDIMKATADGEMPISIMEKEIDALMAENSSFPLSKGLMKYRCKLAPYEYKALILLDLLWIKGNNEVTPNELKFIFEDRRVYQTLSQELQCGTSTLLKMGLAEFVNHNGMATRSTYTVSTKVKKETYAKLLSEAKNTDCIVTKCADIVPKKMYYNTKEEELIDTLTELLKPKRFKQVQKRLSETGMRTGFTCLFYGAPGTGKTETVLQLAKQTGRDVMRVNFAEIRNAFVGESEKSVEKVFSMYRKVVRESDNAPILLIDEADGMMSKRLSNMRDSVDKMENTIQNIILQEMSNMEGVCICTTNLSENLDSAMSRRLLYKVRFEKPCTKAKASIWKSMIPNLSDSDAMTLAMNYDFSGGQIENIARKRAVDSILYGGTITIEKIKQYCESEEITGETTKKIGFN